MYSESSIYVVGTSKTNSDNAITQIYKSFFIGFVIDYKNDTVIDLDCASTISTTKKFIQSLFIGKSFRTYDTSIEDDVKKRYHGSSQRAIIVSYKDAQKKYREVIDKYTF